MVSKDSGTVPVTGAATELISAADVRRHMAQIEAAKAEEAMRAMREQEEKKKALMEEFHKPPARTPDQLKDLVIGMVRHAAERGQNEVQVYRFPKELCTDRGRAINNFEPNWPETLTGRPRLAYEAWRDNLKPLGFGLAARILEYPGGMPGDIGLFLTW